MEPSLPTSPGRAIVKAKEDQRQERQERPGNFDIGQRRPSPQMFPPGGPGSANPLQFLQNNIQNNMAAPVSHSMLSKSSHLTTENEDEWNV